MFDRPDRDADPDRNRDKAAYQAALRTVTYFNGSNAPSPLPRTVTWIVHDGDTPSAGATSTITVTAVNDAPLVTNETFELLGNTELRVDMPAGTTPNTTEATSGPSPVKGVLDNDSDPEGDPFTVTAIANCTVADTTAPFDCTLTDGAIVHVEAKGEFSYTPAPGAAPAASPIRSRTRRRPGCRRARPARSASRSST